jgi:uncharacterized membrane protein YdjX (TVP38/TMEM64 family)
MNKKRIKTISGIIFVVILFVIISYISNNYLDSIKNLFSDDYASMFIYLILVILEIILAPLTLIPVIPLASSIWGNFSTFILTLIGWVIGSLIVFLISRKIGLPLFEKITSKEEIEKIRNFVPQKNLFLGVIIIRIFLPFDIFSYGISLFTRIKLRDYILATLIGFAPLTFIFSFFGEFSMTTQIILAITGTILIAILLLFRKELKKLFIKVFR